MQHTVLLSASRCSRIRNKTTRLRLSTVQRGAAMKRKKPPRRLGEEQICSAHQTRQAAVNSRKTAGSPPAGWNT